MRIVRIPNAFYYFTAFLVTTIVADAKRNSGSSSISAQCDLPCTNGGICKRRQLTKYVLNDQDARLEQDITKQQQELEPHRHYCQCPTGYVGSMCEIKLILCPTGINGTCSNGNPCKRSVDDKNEEYYHCECDILQSDLSLPYAEKFCTHESTVFCINDIDAKNIKKNRQSLGGGSRSSFCINGGTCKDVVTGNGNHVSSCHCPSDYTGSHCEISKKPSATTSKKQKTAASSTTSGPSSRPHRNIFVTIFVFFVCFFTIIAVSLTLLIWYGNRNRIPRKPKKSALDRAKIPKQSDHTTMTYEEVNTNEDV
jgi:hypothetical protein